MPNVFRAALLSTVLVLPAMAHAQNASQANGDACDQLLQALNKPGAPTSVTKEQAQTYKTNNDLAACRTALQKVKGSDDNTALNNQPPGQNDAAQNNMALDQNKAAQAGQPGQTAEANGAQIQVQQPAPKVTVTEAQPTVTVNQGQPQIQIHQPAPTITVQIPQPEVTITMPKPQVNVAQAQPKVSVDQAKPEVNVVPSQQQAQTETNSSGQPIVKFTADKAKVTVTQAEKPDVRFAQSGSANAQPQDQQAQAAAGANADQTAMADQNGQMQAGANTDQQMAAAGQNNDQMQAALANPPLNNGQQAAAGQAQQVAVSKLEGMDLMGTDDQKAVGKITAVILDANNKPFVIVDKSGQQVAVDVDYTRMKGNDLMLSGVANADNLPPWDSSKLQSKEVKKLSGDQKISIQTAL